MNTWMGRKITEWTLEDDQKSFLRRHILLSKTESTVVKKGIHSSWID